jgi:hypothetical protein
MKVKDLINKLQKYPQDMDVMILDSFNGGGVPREINLGPVEHEITTEDINETADCEDIGRQTVVVMGYGCY